VGEFKSFVGGLACQYSRSCASIFDAWNNETRPDHQGRSHEHRASCREAGASRVRRRGASGRITLEALHDPDEIRGGKNGPDDPAAFHYSTHPKIDAQLREYWHANPPTKDLNSPTPSHHWFHYTDVPVADAEKYGDGKVGARMDVVHISLTASAFSKATCQR